MSANVDTVISGPAYDQPPKVQVDIEESVELGKFFEALAAAQGEMANALKDSKNPHFNSSFADLESVVEAIKEPLSKHKIARYQQPLTRNNCTEVGVRTKLGHASGQWMAATVWCKAERPGPQALGSVITYLRRYSLAAAAGVAPADDDGEAAEGRGNGGASKQAPKSAPPSRAVTEGQTKALDRAMRLQKLLTAAPPDGCGWTIPKCKNWVRRYFHVDASTALTEQQLADGELLAMAFMDGGDVAYRNQLKELAAAGRIFDGEAA